MASPVCIPINSALGFPFHFTAVLFSHAEAFYFVEVPFVYSFLYVDPAVPLLGLYSKNPETPIQKNLCIPKFIAAQFTISKCWKQPKCPPLNEWIKKQWYIYTMEFYEAERKKELIPFATAWMELESIMLSKISQMVRDKYHMISPSTGT